jgi:hypothetical protein
MLIGSTSERRRHQESHEPSRVRDTLLGGR